MTTNTSDTTADVAFGPSSSLAVRARRSRSALMSYGGRAGASTFGGSGAADISPATILWAGGFWAGGGGGFRGEGSARAHAASNRRITQGRMRGRRSLDPECDTTFGQ